MSTLWQGRRDRRGNHLGRLGVPRKRQHRAGMLRSDLAVAGTELEVEIYGERVKAVVQRTSRFGILKTKG